MFGATGVVRGYVPDGDSGTKKPSHMHGGLQRHTAYTVRKYVAGMAMHDTVHRGEALVYLAVDAALKVAWFYVLLHSCCVFDVVFYDVIGGAHERW